MTIPFEIHITIGDLPISREQAFIAACQEQAAKPLIIELSQGEHMHQPMLSKVIYAEGLGEVLDHAKDISQDFSSQDFSVQRLKIEVPSFHHELFSNEDSSFERYFEWHGKIELREKAQLLSLCEVHKVHLSRNSLKNEAQIRFVTLREFGTQQHFERRLQTLTQALTQGGWPIIKQQAEYCIYDNNTFLDAGWLPQS
jgi:hypothetical protein